VLLYELLPAPRRLTRRRCWPPGLDENAAHSSAKKEPARPSTCLSAMGKTIGRPQAKHRTDRSRPKLIHLLRGDLDWIVMKALEKDRTRRYETANELASDVQRHLGNQPVSARPPSFLYVTRKIPQATPSNSRSPWPWAADYWFWQLFVGTAGPARACPPARGYPAAFRRRRSRSGDQNHPPLVPSRKPKKHGLRTMSTV